MEMCRWHCGAELAHVVDCHRHILIYFTHSFYTTDSNMTARLTKRVAQYDHEFATPKDFVDQHMLNGGCGDRFKAAVSEETFSKGTISPP